MPSEACPWDPGVFGGSDFDPDWDGTPLADLISSQTERRFAYTWRNDNSTFSPGRLDYIIYSDSVLEPGNHFIVYSPEMSPAWLAATGIQTTDVTIVSDHLPHIGDFHAIQATAVGRPDPPKALAFAGGTIGRDGIRFALELAVASEVTVEVFDARGARVRTIATGMPLMPGRHPFAWDGRAHDGHAAASGVYFAHASARVVSGPTSGSPRARPGS